MDSEAKNASKLALLGGVKSVTLDQEDMFKWPIVTAEHEEAVLKVLRSGQMSGFDITKQFEAEYAGLLGRKYALTTPNGTSAVMEAMYALGIGAGDEVICPSITFWASIVQCYVLGATPVFADIDPDNLCIDPKDIEHRITDRTKAIVVVHYSANPADMDAIMAIGLILVFSVLFTVPLRESTLSLTIGSAMSLIGAAFLLLSRRTKK